MNSKVKGILMMSAMMSLSLDSFPQANEHRINSSKKDTSYLRKKCKSCKYFRCKLYQSPLERACENYKKK